MREYDLEKQHKKGKLHAIERIGLLLDEGSFREFGSGVSNCGNELGMKYGALPYDGVIAGYGNINGKKVFIYSQDFTVMGGTLGKHHGKKIAHTIEMAVKSQCPVIGINDSGGARIQEGVDSLSGYGDIFYWNTQASGYIPQISIIAGPCAGGAVYSPGITDFIFNIENISNMYVTGPKVIRTVTNQRITPEELGGSGVHAAKSGVAHFKYPTEHACYKAVRNLIDILPGHCGEKTIHCDKYLKKMQAGLSHIVPDSTKKAYDVRAVVDKIFDDDSFLEIQEEYAKNLVIGFARLCGNTVGIVANNPSFMAGVLDCDASDKGARFVRFCDAFDIPLVTLVDVPGFLPGIDQELKGIIRHGAKLLYAYAEATAIKLTVILRKAYGGAYLAMCCKQLGADFVYAWPKAEIAVMGADAAAEVIYHKELSKLEKEEKARFLEEKIKEYQSVCMNANKALIEGYVDEAIEPEDTRERLFQDMILLRDKKGTMFIGKKHGNIPL